jgi:hypothetical protein
MTNSNRTVDQKYQEAIQSLRRINNELFYDDLKKVIGEREGSLAEMNEAVYQSIGKMEKSMESFPGYVSRQLQTELIDPQIANLERFEGNLLDMEKRLSLWQKQYLEYVHKTENLLSGLKELLREDQEFAASQTQRVLEDMKLLQDGVREAFAEETSEQAAKMNVKYDAISERLSTILLEMDQLEESRKSEGEHYQQQLQIYLQKQRDQQGTWEEKWKKMVNEDRKRETSIKKWLIGLAVGQGATIGTLVFYLILR